MKIKSDIREGERVWVKTPYGQVVLRTIRNVYYGPFGRLYEVIIDSWPHTLSIEDVARNRGDLM